jgi:hypothetical protein
MRKWRKEHPDTRDRRVYQKEYQKEYRKTHPDVAIKSRAKWKKANLEKYRETTNRCRRKYRYHIYAITEETYQAMVDNQGGRCAICDTAPLSLCIDHDHITKKIRGLLCSKCNSGIGFLNDDLKLLKRAVGYLENGVLGTSLSRQKEGRED